MKKRYYYIVILICLFQNLQGQTDYSSIVKVERVYLENGRLTDEVHYDKKGRKVKSIRFNVTMGHHYLYNVDSIVRIFTYDSLNSKANEYGYSVRDSIREKTELKIQYHYNDFGQLILKKHAHKAFSDEYFTYDESGNLIKDSSDVVYLLKYEYSTDSLISKES